MMGSANAAVLPVPVAAWPRRSRPSMSGRIVCSWIGVGSSYPSAMSAATILASRPSAVNRSPSVVELEVALGIPQYAKSLKLHGADEADPGDLRGDSEAHG